VELLTHRTDAGPEVIALSDPAAFTVSLGWFVKTGSRDEKYEIAGVSHFLEHMVFKGTSRRSAEVVNRELDHLGAQSNAYTSEDSTVFYASVVPECQSRAVDLLTDLMAPSLGEQEFETERQVVLEEIAMYDDQPPYGAFEKAMELFFGNHPLATRVLGTVETVSEMSVAQMREYHSQRYTRDNMFLVASGDHVERHTQGWPTGAAPRQYNSPLFSSSDVLIEREATHQHYAVKLWPGLSCNDPQRYALRMLCTILADDSGSRLFWELIDTGRAETAALWPQLFDDCGCLLGYLCCAPEDAEENLETMQTVFEDVIKKGVTKKELELAKNKIQAGLILSDERPSNRLFALGQSWLTRRAYEPLDVILERFASVSQQDILDVAHRTLNHKPTTVQIIDPES
jgi:predicted Zn-dependent peptidase